MGDDRDRDRTNEVVDLEPVEPVPEHLRRPRRQVLLALGVVVVVVAGAVLVTGNIGQNRDGNDGGQKVRVDRSRQVVADAVAATSTAGSFDMTFKLSETPGETDGVDPCESQSLDDTSIESFTTGGCIGYAYTLHNVVITGHGTISLDPKAMVSVAKVPGLGEITTRVNDTLVWEYGGADYGTSVGPNGQAADGAPISGFASLVQGTLGQREGAIAMMSLASPTGYLALTPEALSAAKEVRHETVAGVALTYYQIDIATDALARDETLTPEQRRTIDAALVVLDAEGYRGASAMIAIGDDGFIHWSERTFVFADGGTVVGEATFSNFHCAGTVLMPGQDAAQPAPDPSCPTQAATTETSIAPVTETTPGAVPEPDVTTAP